MSVDQPNEIFCRNCRRELSAHASACVACGLPPMAGRKYCWHCGADTAEAAVLCVKCQAQLPHAPALYQPPKSDKKLLAGLLALLIPGLGIHKFVLGYNTEGITMLLITVLTCGIGGIVMVPISMIEGIIYLTKSDEEFDLVYVQNKRGWF